MNNLLTLYKVDRQVRSLRSRVESAEIYLNIQNKQLQEIETQRSENEQQVKQRKSNIALIETETGSIDERVNHLRDELNQAVNDKQYSALLAEVNTLKERRKAYEDEELIEMAAVEELETTASEIGEKFEDRQKVTVVAEKDLQTREKEVAKRLNELETEREHAAEMIPQEALSIFDGIADDFDGEAMASIEVIDLKRHEYSCTCCSLTLPLEAITTMLGNQDSIVSCPSCDRILYLEAETRELMTAGK